MKLMKAHRGKKLRQVVLDFRNAFFQFPVSPAEQRFFATRLKKLGVRVDEVRAGLERCPSYMRSKHRSCYAVTFRFAGRRPWVIQHLR